MSTSRQSPTPRVLVIDDEPRIVRLLSRALVAEGFSVESAVDGVSGLELAREGVHDLVILDLLLPHLTGFSVLEGIMSTRPEKPVVVLSALTDVESKVRCLELGASDYVPKPFALAELVARVRARLRETQGPPPARVLRAGTLTLDLMRRVADNGLGPVRLSEREFVLLQFLMRRAGQVFTREELLGEAWGYSFDPGSNIVDVYVGRLRAKLGADLIETVRNVGYRLDVW